MKILIVNGDSPNNRGDRAILHGGIMLIRECFPDAEIWAVSDRPERDQEWFGIRFLRMGVQTINPMHLLSLGLFARKCDMVLWGGGELLKDYTNKLGVLYWVLKMQIVRMLNPRIYGFYQGIGPTKSALARGLIVFAVNQTKRFFVRDADSAGKLAGWGVRIPVSSSFDPAILCGAQPLGDHERSQLAEAFGVTAEFLERAIGIGARNWFHYEVGGWIPFRLHRGSGHSGSGDLARSRQYKAALAGLCDRLIAANDANLIFFPMHVSASENDAGFCRDVQLLMEHGDRARIIDRDALSPQTFHNAIGACRGFIGIRLHSFILALTAEIPSMAFYYVDKGRVFAEQVGLTSHCRPIENLLDPTALAAFEVAFTELVTSPRESRDRAAARLTSMRQELIRGFMDAFA